MIITFSFNGKEYTGDLSQVQGAGDTGIYHLLIGNYYKGRLRLSAFDNRWFLIASLLIWLKILEYFWNW